MARRRTWAMLGGVALIAAACATGGAGVGGAPATNVAPTAAIAPSTTSGAAPLLVTFDAWGSTDSDGAVAAYSWNFGDGGTGSGPTAGHTFAPGTWTVSLVVTDNLGATDIETVSITSSNDAPVAAFIASTSSGIAPLGVTFDAAGSDDPDGSIVTYDWDFGDGDAGSGLNASHSFDDGSWTVTLTVTDNVGGTDTATATVNVVNPAPVAAISANIVSGPAPLAVSFNGSASNDANGPIVAYAWNFGGGVTSSLANPSHTFGVGVHSVTLTVTDDDGVTATATTTITATNQLPTATFTRSPASGSAPLAVSFNSGGSSDPDGTIAGYSWSFGDGGTATGPNPNHTFPVGTWTVTLTVTDNVGGTDSETATVTVTNALPTASFTTSPASGNAPLGVAFNAAGSTDPNGTIVSYGWNFNDGGTASGVNPSHVFGVGTFTVTLTVTDNHGGTATTTRTVTSNNVAPVASFVTTPASGGAPLNVAFNASGSTDSSGPITGYAWDFDTAWAFPGDTASGVTTSHVYTPGVYTARLTVTDVYGASSSTTRTVTVTGSPTAPTGLHKTGSGCCDTYGDFAWSPVPGADGYEISMNGYFLGGCVTDHGAVINGQVSSGRVQAVGLCLGSSYDVSIRTRANGVWGPWSPSVNIGL